MKYKRLVRDTMGSSSRQYQGFRFRAGSGSSDDAGEVEGEQDAPDALAAYAVHAAPPAPPAPAAPELAAPPSVH